MNIILKGDKSNIENVGISEFEYIQLRTALAYGIMKGFTNDDIDRANLTDEMKDNLKNDILTGFSKVDYEVVSSSVDKNAAKVDVSIRGINMNKVIEYILKKHQEEDTEAMTDDELAQASYKYVGEGIASGFIADQPSTITLTFNKKGGTWVMQATDIDLLMMAAFGQENNK